MPEPVASLDEIRALVAHLPGPDLDAGAAAALREKQLTKPAGALGRLAELAACSAAMRRHGPAREPVSSAPRSQKSGRSSPLRWHGTSPRPGTRSICCAASADSNSPR